MGGGPLRNAIGVRAPIEVVAAASAATGGGPPVLTGPAAGNTDGGGGNEGNVGADVTAGGEGDSDWEDDDAETRGGETKLLLLPDCPDTAC
jgi:hypothetical protein